MDFATIRPALKTWVETITGIPDRNVYWFRKPRGWRGLHAILRMNPPANQGRDAVNYEDTPGAPAGQEITPIVTGNREFTLQIKVISYSEDDDKMAMYYTDLIHDSLRLPTSIAAFRAVSIGFQQVMSHVDLEEIKDSRDTSVAQIDLRFNADTRLEGTATTNVEHWGVKSDTLNLPDGTPAANQIDDILP
jgi:hypothetical protein